MPEATEGITTASHEVYEIIMQLLGLPIRVSS